MLTRLLFLLALAAAVVVPSAQTAPLPAPTGMRGFMLRADEPVDVRRFARTPSFAWAPYAGARSYDFELATNKTFDESSVIWSTASPLTVPEVAIPISLPWMTGNPYALYVHVRARTASGLSRWSTPWGFNMRWNDDVLQNITPDVPGLLRWRPVDGATSYNVWFVDAGKVINTTTNVADEREFYTFHPDALHTAVVRWRVQAVREVYGGLPNALPTSSHGPWSETFIATNPAVTSGPISLDETVSDVAVAAASTAAHTLTPAFAWSGGYTATNRLFRVYVATDRQCVNIVFKGSIVGSPVYAPRTAAPGPATLGLPATFTEIAKVATGATTLADGRQGGAYTADLEPITPNEEDSGDSEANPPDVVPPSTIPWTAKGVKVDLWDSGWPSGLYFWTVVPVREAPVGVDGVRYIDAEVPQDACANGRVAAFGKASQPTTVSSSVPYISGLSPTGELVTARTAKPAFYRGALIAWQPALGATGYEVQWSRTLYPWKSASATPLYTASTSVLLQGLVPGTWYYRVRGIDPYVPGPVKQMAWSDPVQFKLAKPTFSVQDGSVTVRPVK